MRVPVRFTWQEAIAVRRFVSGALTMPGDNPHWRKALQRLDDSIERAVCHRCRTRPRRDHALVCTTCWNKGYRRKGSPRPPRELSA